MAQRLAELEVQRTRIERRIVELKARRHVIGVYPMLEDGTCRFLAVDGAGKRKPSP